MNLGAILHLNGKLPEAEANYLRALQLKPDDVITQSNLRKLWNIMERQGLRQGIQRSNFWTKKLTEVLKRISHCPPENESKQEMKEPRDNGSLDMTRSEMSQSVMLVEDSLWLGMLEIQSYPALW